MRAHPFVMHSSSFEARCLALTVLCNSIYSSYPRYAFDMLCKITIFALHLPFFCNSIQFSVLRIYRPVCMQYVCMHIHSASCTACVIKVSHFYMFYQTYNLVIDPAIHMGTLFTHTCVYCLNRLCPIYHLMQAIWILHHPLSLWYLLCNLQFTVSVTLVVLVSHLQRCELIVPLCTLCVIFGPLVLPIIS